MFYFILILYRSSRDINLLRTRFTTRAAGMRNCQSYRDRTCEVVFAGLESATASVTEFDSVRRFCAAGDDAIYKVETMLAGIRHVLTENLCKCLRSLLLKIK